MIAAAWQRWDVIRVNVNTPKGYKRRTRFTGWLHARDRESHSFSLEAWLSLVVSDNLLKFYELHLCNV